MFDPFADDAAFTSDVPRSRLSLRIRGEALDPDFLTQQLGMSPTSSAQPGDEGEPTGRWVYRVSGASGTELGELLDRLIAALPQDATLWEELTSTYAVDVLCELFLEGDRQRTGVDASILERLGRFGLPLELDLHAPSESDSDS